MKRRRQRQLPPEPGWIVGPRCRGYPNRSEQPKSAQPRSRRSGTYTYLWNDPEASEHYGRRLTLRVSVRFPDGSQFPLATSTYDTRSFGWRC